MQCNRCGQVGHTGAEDHCTVCNVHPAPHKVGEEGHRRMNFHNMTARMCCVHFTDIIGDCASWPTHAHPDRHPWAFVSPVDTRDYSELEYLLSEKEGSTE